METRRVRLRPLGEADLGFLYELMTSPESGGRVRYAGATPSPEKVAATLWDSVLAQFMIERAETGKRLGLVAVTSANFRDAHAYVSALGSRESRGLGLIMEGVLLGFNYAFSTWPFRKLYMEATDDSYEEFRSGLGVFFEEEGRLKRHVFWNGRYADLSILAVYRDTWADRAPRMLERLCRPAPEAEARSHAAGERR